MKPQQAVTGRPMPYRVKAVSGGLHFLAVFLVYLLFCLLVRYDASAGNRPLPCTSLQARLSAHLTLPAVLEKHPGSAVVVVQFRIDAAGRLTTLKVHTDNARLRHELAGQLDGVKLGRQAGCEPQLYTVRLRFRR